MCFVFFDITDQLKIFGRKIMHPIIAETIDTTKTAAAARSFAFPAFSFLSGMVMSTLTSIEVLISSAAITELIQNNNTHNSSSDTLKMNAVIKTITAAKK
jgi:hypothetical protein